MNTGKLTLMTIILILAGLVLVACGQPAAPTVDVDAAVQTALAATRVIETQVAQAVAETLAAAAPAETPTPSPQPTDTPTTAPVTATAAAVAEPTATATPVPTNTPPPAATPTPTPVRIAIVPVDGDDGNDYVRGSTEINNGRAVILPDRDPAQVGSPPTFRDDLTLRVEVFDTRAGLVDGAGIESVTFRIVYEDTGEVKWEKVEAGPAYCLFGGNEPACPSLDLSRSNRWPDPFGQPIVNGFYLAEIDIVPVQGDATQWRWRFAVDSPYLADAGPAAPPNTAQITGISVQDGRYIVDFEAYGFEPVMPGQHVHFFFNTVPLEQAGTPGSGPWKLYPAAPGQPGTSPYTGLALSDRPEAATELCILVANADHSVIPGTGNCALLP